MSGSMSGMWKRGTVWIMRHRQTKGPDTDRPDLNNRATPRLYLLSLPKDDRKKNAAAIEFCELGEAVSAMFIKWLSIGFADHEG